MHDEFNELEAKYTKGFCRKARNLGVKNPEDLVNKVWGKLAMNISWMEGRSEAERVKYIDQAVKWKCKDFRNKRNIEVPLDDRAEKEMDDQAELSDGPDDISFKRLLQKIKDYKGPAPKPSEATDWHLPFLHEQKLKDCLKRLNTAGHDQAIQIANDIFISDLERVPNNMRPKKGRHKLELELGLEAASEKPQIRPLILRKAQIVLDDFVIWSDTPEKFVYRDFIEPYHKFLHQECSPYIEELGEPELSSRERAVILRRLRPYFENLKGKDLAKGKALILNKYEGWTVEEIANEMFLTYNQVRTLIERAKSEIRSLKDKTN